MFEKIVVVDSTGLNTWGVERLKEFGKEVVFYTGIPETDEEIVNRIGDADCVLVSYNTQIRRNVIEACPNNSSARASRKSASRLARSSAGSAAASISVATT